MKNLRLAAFLTLLIITPCGAFAQTKDCFEKFNRGVFGFNMFLDKNLFKPVAQGYSYLPSPIKKGVRNITSNISHTVTIPNNLLQGNLPGAINETGRFILLHLSGGLRGRRRR